MNDSTDNARELAYQAYINEVTPNGNTRIDNLTLCNIGPKAHQHIATQVDLAFQAGWQARADLPPTDAEALAHPKVRALVEALEAAVDCGMVPKSSVKDGGAAKYARQVVVADMIRAALAAIQEAKP